MKKSMMRSRLIFLLVFPLLISFFLITRPQPIRAEEIYKVAVQPEHLPIAMWEKVLPLTTYLEERLGIKFKLIIGRTFEEHRELVKQGKVNFSYQNPYAFLQLGEYCLPLVLTEKGKKWGIECRGVIITRRDSGINKLEDLNGKTVSITSLQSADGFIAQKIRLRGTLNVNTDLTIVESSRNIPEDVIAAVLRRKTDAGFVAEEVLKNIQTNKDLWPELKAQIKDIKIIAYTDYIPNWIFSADKRVTARVRDMVQEALLNIPVGDPALKAAEIRRFVPIPTNYLEEFKAKVERR
jgi:phosphonate transport system substrate-binding protein